MPPPGRPTPLPCVESEVFAGPLDLLLAEVRRQNVAIEDVAMAPLAARFLEYVRSAAARNLNLDMEWLHLAATLIHWKSLALLPREDRPQADAVRDDIVRLIEAHYKEAAGDLARRRAEEAGRLGRGAGAPGETADVPEGVPWLTAWDMARQARDLAFWVERHRVDRERWRDDFGIDPDEVTIAEMMEYLSEQLAANGGEMDVAPLLEGQSTVGRRAGLFLGMLQMASEQRLQIAQREAFGPIIVKYLVHQT